MSVAMGALHLSELALPCLVYIEHTTHKEYILSSVVFLEGVLNRIVTTLLDVVGASLYQP